MPTANSGAPASIAGPIPPLLGLWALLVAAVLTFAGAKINLVFIQALLERAQFPAMEQPHATPTRAGIVLEA